MDAVDEKDVNLIHWMDSTAQLVQNRLIKVCQISLKDHQRVESPPAPPWHTHLDSLTELGHEIISTNNRDHCVRCISNWHRKDRKNIIANGRCDPDLWGEGPPLCKEVPWVLPLGKQMLFGGKRIHAPHHLAWYRGILYCLKCGCYSEVRVKSLSDQCKLNPSGANALSGMNRMKAGLHPRTGILLTQTKELPPSYIEDCTHSFTLAIEDQLWR